MKKLLFLAFTAILGMSVNAQETLLSERPEGIVKVYDRAGKGIKLQQGDDGSLEMNRLNLSLIMPCALLTLCRHLAKGSIMKAQSGKWRG